jgi:hypothetical protein
MSFDLTLTALQQRIAALILALVPLLLIAAGIVSFVSAQIAHHERVALLVRELNYYKAILHEEPRWRAQLATVRSSYLWQNLFLSDAKSTAVNGISGNRLTQIVTSAGGTVLQSSIDKKDAGQDGAGEVDENIVFTADITTLTHVLYELRAPTPLFVLRRLSIRDLEGGLSGPRTVPNPLHVELTVAGYVRPS